MAGETPVGSIVGFLRLDASDFHREIERAIAETEVLDGKRVKVDVEAGGLDKVAGSARSAAGGLDEATRSSRRLEDATGRVNVAMLRLSELNESGKAKASQLVTARQALAKAQREEQDAIFATYGENIRLAESQDRVVQSGERVEETHKKSAKAARENRAQVGALATAIITLGPALVPVAAGAAGLGAAFGGMGAAGVLAIVGIRDEMQRGTTVGLAYKAGVDDVKAGMMDLAGVAAGNVLGSFQQVVGELDAAMPGLRTQIGELSTVTGSAAANLAGGLLSAFQALGPLMQDVSIYVEGLTSRFKDAMSGPGVVAFGDYVRSVFPQVMQALEDIVGAAANLVQALAPLGLGTLSMIKMLADVISAIPVDVLSTLAQVAGNVFLAFKTWEYLSGKISGVSAALELVGVKASAAATAVRGLQIAAGVISVALAALTYVVSANAESQRASEQATNDLADALIRSNGAIDENVRLTALKNAQDSGAIDNARMLGITTQQVVDAYLGQGGALGDLSAQRDAALTKQKALVDAGKADASTMSDVETAYLNLKNELAAAGIQWDGTKVKVQQHNDALAGTKTAADNAAVATQSLANTYGTSAANFQAVITSQQGLADKAAQATLKMQLENDAAGLLKQSLDALSGKSISAAQAQNSFDSQLANMGTHVDKVGKQITFTTTSIHDMSAASVALRGQLLGQITAAQDTAEKYGELKGSAEAGRLKLIDLKKQIVDNAVAHGVDKKAVQAYVDEFLKIPKKVPPTKLQIDKAEADAKIKAFQAHVNGLHGKTVKITTLMETINYVTSGDSSYQAAKNRSALADMRNEYGSLTLSSGVRAMAQGGLTGSRDSMIHRAMRPILWNEAPGGEAYISLAPQKRKRSQAIWEETGDLIGANRGGTTQTNHINLYGGGATPKAIIRELDWSL